MKCSLVFRGVVAVLVLGSAAGLGCYTGSSTDTNRLPDPKVTLNGTDPSTPGPGQDGPDASTHTPRGLPCDVAAVVATSCMQCHGAVPSGGAQNRLLTYEDFTAKPSDPSFKSVAELALSRMKSSSRPMPPDGRIDASSMSMFEKWVNGGLVRGTCAETQPDGGADDPPPGGDPDGGWDDPTRPESVCTSGIPITEPEDPSELMRPGETCISCHNAQQGPLFEVAGTVYPTPHEPDDCRGRPETTVIIVDASGFVHTLTTNSSGNFYFDQQLPRPYRALVARGAELREMQAPQWNGDCNSCHTEWGASSAPGRISIP